MIALLGGVFVASLAGSLHCAGMCGGLAAAACIGCRAPGESAAAVIAYQLARGLGYASAGAVAGAVGGAIDLGGGMIGVQRLAGVVAGSMVAIGGAALLMRHGGMALRAHSPPRIQALLAAAHRRAAGIPPMRRAAAIGALSVLLPCGWLWAFLAVAAGAGSIAAGAAVMAAFWAGSVPILGAMGAGATRVGTILRGRAAPIVGTAMVVVGVHSAIMAGARGAAIDADVRATSQRCDAIGAGEALSAANALDRAADEVPACCRTEAAP